MKISRVHGNKAFAARKSPFNSLFVFVVAQFEEAFLLASGHCAFWELGYMP